MKTHPPHTRGAVLLLALVFMGIFLTVFSSMVSYATLYARVERHTVASVQALSLAEAGIDKAIYELNQNGNYSGENNTALGNGTFTTSVASIDSSTKRITSIGYIPNNVTPTASKEVQANVSINSEVVSFRFGVQVGAGGVTMGNGSQINGSLFSNGSVSGGGTITGDATVAGGALPTIDQEWTTQNSDFNLGDISARANLAQSFTAASTTALNKVSLNLKKVGAPGDITVKIVTDDGGTPSKTELASGSLIASSVTGSYSFVDASLSSYPSLTSGTKYWIIAIASVNASNYFLWATDNTNSYTNGEGMYSTNWNAGNPVWNNVNGDLNFKTYMGGSNTSLTGITVQGNAYAHTLSSCTINGDAYYQTNSCSVGGTLYPGSADQSQVPLVPSDGQIQEWRDAAAIDGTVGGLTVAGTQSLGPKKILGNLIVDTGATLNVTGTLWVTGQFLTNNNSTIQLDPSFGTASGVIVVDDTSSVANNTTITGSGQVGSYTMVVVAKNAPTSHVLDISNNATGVIFSAPHGRIHFNNNAGGKEVTGYGFDMENNSTITYDSGLQNETFSNGPGGSWGFVPGTYTIVP